MERLAVKHAMMNEHVIGRILAEPVGAKSLRRISRLGYGRLCAAGRRNHHAMPTRPVTLQYGAQVEYVDTGDPLPAWANAVVPIELVEPLDESGSLAENPRKPHAIRLRAALTPWKNVRPLGEDIVATQLVLPAGHRLRPADLGAIAASGHTQVKISRKPRVAISPPALNWSV
jgi:putative molybdopterin biosynthesis protein